MGGSRREIFKAIVSDLVKVKTTALSEKIKVAPSETILLQ